ncbi:hypothetical protein OCO53_25655 [Peribacillus frigoritolerans]|nr:hypothetical protein [Peribacillus frigoritolerans]MCU6603830.1 hypothetical protein [Peribacillus frigoritolerans]
MKHHVYVHNAAYLKEVLQRYHLGLKNIFDFTIDGEEVTMNQLLERLGLK